MPKGNHDLLWIALAAGGGWLGYEFVYKPWAANQAAIAAGAASAGGLALPGITSMVSGPSAPITNQDQSLVPGQVAPIYSSNPSLMYPGPVGTCMSRKGNTWTAAQCTTRLNALIVAYNNAMQQIANLKANTSNPAASGIAAAQAQLAVYDSTITQQQAALAQQPAGSQGYQQFATSIAALQVDRQQLAQRIAAASSPVDNSAAIAAYQGQAAANDNDFFNLTGQHLAVGMATF
jgi:hypothetical protein